MNVRPTRAAPPPPTATKEPEEATFTEVAQHAPPAVREQQQEELPMHTHAPSARPDMPPTGFAKLASAIAAVMAELKPVEKAGWNDFHKYKYAKMGDLSIELTPLMGKHGIVVFQNEIDRAMFDEGRVISVRYEFTIAHSSGETWPERPLITGMSACRTSNGKFDDKSFNKAHTAARKYFLLSLFQIPTEDDEDGDNGGEGGGNRERPRGQQQAPARRAPSPDGKTPPHLIAIINGEPPTAWGDRFIAAIGKATSSDEINKWYDANFNTFEKIKGIDADLYDRLLGAMDDREVVVMGGVPASTNGKAPPPPGKSADEEWLESLENAFSACEDAMSIGEQQERLMMPAREKVSPAVWKLALVTLDKHIKRVTG